MQNVVLFITAMYWLPLLYILRTFGVDRHLTISDHVSSGQARRINVVTTVISSTTLLVFGLLWLAPKYDISWAGYVLLCAAYAGIMTTTVIPRVAMRVSVHDAFAAVTGVSIFFFLSLFVFSASISNFTQSLLLICLLAMAVIGPLLLKKNRRNFLPLQISYYALFYVSLVVLSYF